MPSDAVVRWMHIAQRISRTRYDCTNPPQAIENQTVPLIRPTVSERPLGLLYGCIVSLLSIGVVHGTARKGQRHG